MAHDAMVEKGAAGAPGGRNSKSVRSRPAGHPPRKSVARRRAKRSFKPLATPGVRTITPFLITKTSDGLYRVDDGQLPDELPVPGEQRLGPHQERSPQLPRHRSARRRQQHPVETAQTRALHLPLKHP